MFCIKKVKHVFFAQNLRKTLFFAKNCCFDLDSDPKTQQKPIGNELRVVNTFSKQKQTVLINGESVNVGNQTANSERLVKIYVCGPTVYDYSHLGHALTYIRFDLFVRALRSVCGLQIITAMNITDIDDKIIAKATHENKSARSVADFYYSAFLDDMSALNVTPANVYLRVTNHICDIVKYINRLQNLGFAYHSPETNDINFESSQFPFYLTTERTEKSLGKRSPADFALWKASKPNEPFWIYTNPKIGSEMFINGRPGWHVECSVLANGIFGSNIDFHYGGRDLKFPHHYNESLCCHAYHKLKDENVCGWAKYWLHSGQLRYANEKMSKSLGNIITIKQFLKNYHFHILRIICIRNHYREDLNFDETLLQEATSIDSKFKHFFSFLNREIDQLCSSEFASFSDDSSHTTEPILNVVRETQLEIERGIADDIDLNRGLEAVLKLMKLFQALPRHTFLDLIIVGNFIKQWTSVFGFKYDVASDLNFENPKNSIIIERFLKFREEVRQLSAKNLMNMKKTSQIDPDCLKKILSACDEIRRDMKEYGIVIQDTKSVKS
ncbi:putative cysteine--tRNA ligase-like protein [Dinothrombium tinctorium]|uniref:cysteine--tRNA ligase n=1 Tax=Dinothrombium tinctorium TaxID=1965070 RepID=A0A3S3NW80_9ACAR|nr:putative cysteine--tRNA ligase-like protein [Dinothrombium tinctorium]